MWTGKPWVLPELVGRSILIIAVAVIVGWLEASFSNVTGVKLPIMSLPMWTGLVLFLAWVISLMHLVVLRVSNTYILRNDGLEVRTGVFESKAFVVAPSGFSDLEVIRSISARIVNSGDIVIRTQGERNIVMQRVRDAMNVADRIREVMSRPIVRIEGQNAPVENK